MPTKFCHAPTWCDAIQSQEDKEVQDFVIIGNGPSGISLSFLLSGNLPYYVGETQDELLHARLTAFPDVSLVKQDLDFLSEGLEGRSNNPVSLLFDTLQHPQADLGLELPSLLEWRNEPESRSRHVVLGRGNPGGVWQTLNGNLQTVSSGSWMQLPNLSMFEWKEQNTAFANRRTSVYNVAQYYMDYVEIMGLAENFRNNTVVTGVKQVKPCAAVMASSPSSPGSSSPQISPQTMHALLETENIFSLEEDELSSECSSITHHSASPSRDSLRTTKLEDSMDGSCSERSSDCYWSPPLVEFEAAAASPGGTPQRCDMLLSRHISIPGYDPELCPSWDPIINPSLFSFQLNNSLSLSCATRNSFQPSSYIRPTCCPVRKEEEETLYEVTGYEIHTFQNGKRKNNHFKYLTKNVVLATGLDKANRLGVEGEDLSFVIHSLRELEEAVEAGGLTPNSDPILVIGAGLSAADAIISAQGHDIPVVHLFRRAVDDPQLIFNKLPVNLYPEYHNVHRMMSEGSIEVDRQMKGETVEREHLRYQSYAQTVVKNISRDRRVTIIGPNTETEMQVSYVLVLIGASPNLEFLNTEIQLGKVDKNNPIEIDAYTHESVNIPGLFAMGPLTGDNFVRFLQGGALAISSFAHKQRLKRQP